jgi:phage-related protein (TIGR01555 family)
MSGTRRTRKIQSLHKINDAVMKTFTTRMDSFMHKASGKGVKGKDSLTDYEPNPIIIEPGQAREWYDSNGYIKNIIDAPAEDATKEWIRLKTNRDKDDPETGLPGLDLSRKIMLRLEDLDLQNKLKELIHNSRLFYNGGLLFFGVNADTPQTEVILRNKIPNVIRKLEFINSFPSDVAGIRYMEENPLSINYHKYDISVRGESIHSSRVAWLVNSFDRRKQRGRSVLETILEGAFAQDSALWSVTSMIKELSVKIFRTDQMDSMPDEMKMKFLYLMNHALNTQKTVLLGEKENFERIGNPGIQGTSLRDMLDFIWENLSGLAMMPKSKILGQSQGVITAGEYDLVSYYESIHKFQELLLRPIIDRVINLVIRETEGEVYKLLNGNPDTLDWNFEFEPVWRMSPKEEEEVKLSQAQRHQIHITAGVIDPVEARNEAYPSLEDFTSSESEPTKLASLLDFTKPKLNLIKNDPNPENDKKPKML